MVAGSEVRLLILVSLDSGTKCVDDCVADMITVSVGGEATSEISYIGIEIPMWQLHVDMETRNSCVYWFFVTHSCNCE